MPSNITKITLEQMTELMDAHVNTKFFPNCVLSVAANHIAHHVDFGILRDLFKRHNILANVKNDDRLQAFSLSSTCKVAAGSRTSIMCYGTDPAVLLAHMVHHVSMAKKVASRVGMNSVLFFWTPLSQDGFLMKPGLVPVKNFTRTCSVLLISQRHQLQHLFERGFIVLGVSQ